MIVMLDRDVQPDPMDARHPSPGDTMAPDPRPAITRIHPLMAPWVASTPDGAPSIVGRSKELIIRSGLNVYPAEVEQAINAHPEVVQSAVVGRTVDSNEEVVAFVERSAGSLLDAAALRAHLRDHPRDHLAPCKIPGDIRFMATLPAAPTGKRLKGVMKTPAQQPAADNAPR